ncbi:MAG TPA: hypothetical protein PK386_06445 [Candidatus Marinimicrobia bacterium]|nr:hypothetical protein [Candidatus Neomarinimicrobiota bacterium]
MSTNPYYDDNSKPIIRDSFCAYIDILGFSERMKYSFQKGRELKLFNKIFSAIDSNVNIFKPTFPKLIKKESLFIKIFTDNIVIGYPVESSEAEYEFGSLITLISYFQISMTLEGLFIRGAIVRGPLFMNENIVFGTSIIDAYNLESRFSSVPRIILSEEVFNLVKSHLRFYPDSKYSPQHQDILIDNDGFAYLNYLTNLDPEYLYWDMVRKHKKYIEYNLRKYINKPDIWYKYFWTANYHNYFVKGCYNYPGYDDKYLVDSVLLQNEPKRISN